MFFTSASASGFSAPPAFWPDRLRASGIHLGLSLGIALLAALLVFGIWYPYPYRDISGGRELFLIVVTVDVILGPLITLAIFNRVKAWPVLRRDLVVVALVQLGALGYGLWTVFVARPVHMVFEYDRFRVVHAIDIAPDQLPKAAPAFNTLPITGPTLLSLRPFKDSNEKFEMTVTALQGLTLAARPELWQAYAAGRVDMLKVARPVAELQLRVAKDAAASSAVKRALIDGGQAAQSWLWIPLAGRKSFWTVLLDAQTLQPTAYLPLDSF
jgi:hypothetical protein